MDVEMFLKEMFLLNVKNVVIGGSHLATITTKTMELPEKYKKLIGNRHTFSGGLFSSKKEIEPTEFKVLDWRWGSAKVFDMEKMKEKHPTVEFLIKREGMRSSRWTRPFPVPEIKF